MESHITGPGQKLTRLLRNSALGTDLIPALLCGGLLACRSVPALPAPRANFAAFSPGLAGLSPRRHLQLAHALVQPPQQAPPRAPLSGKAQTPRSEAGPSGPASHSPLRVQGRPGDGSCRHIRGWNITLAGISRVCAREGLLMPSVDPSGYPEPSLC